MKAHGVKCPHCPAVFKSWWLALAMTRWRHHLIKAHKVEFDG